MANLSLELSRNLFNLSPDAQRGSRTVPRVSTSGAKLIRMNRMVYSFPAEE